MTWTDIHDYLVIGVDSVIVGVLYALYRRGATVVKNITEAPTLSVGPELDHFLLSSPEGEVPFVVIKGRAKELNVGQVIHSKSEGLKGVLQVVSVNEHLVRRTGFGQWGDSVRPIQETHTAVEFGLHPLYEEGKSVIEVLRPFEAQIEGLLSTVSTQFSPSDSSFASTVFGFFTGVASRGVETTEKLLPVDSIVTGIGKLSRHAGGRWKMEQPYNESDHPYIISAVPIEGILKKLNRRNLTLKILTYSFVGIGLVVIGRRIYEYIRLRREAKMRESILKLRSTVDINGLSIGQICIICLTNPREVIILPCGHVALCADCQQKVDKCPVCRKAIVATHAAFIV